MPHDGGERTTQDANRQRRANSQERIDRDEERKVVSGVAIVSMGEGHEVCGYPQDDQGECQKDAEDDGPNKVERA